MRKGNLRLYLNSLTNLAETTMKQKKEILNGHNKNTLLNGLKSFVGFSAMIVSNRLPLNDFAPRSFPPQLLHSIMNIYLV